MDAQIALITIITSNIAEMTVFYREALGFAVKQDMGRYVEFESEGVRFALCGPEVMREATGNESYTAPHSGHTFELAFPCVSREGVDTSYAHLIAYGAQPVRAPLKMPWGQYTGFFADPDGNIHEIFCDTAADA